jgi:cbb3-type cytochrome oxidase maturation protein
VETIFVLLPLALLIAAIAVGFFIWAARTGQFDDLDTPAVRILFDDEEPRRPGRLEAAARSSAKSRESRAAFEGSREPGVGPEASLRVNDEGRQPRALPRAESQEPRAASRRVPE